MLRFILDMTEVPPSWLAWPEGCCTLDALRLKLLAPGGAPGPPLGLELPPPCADLNDVLTACKVEAYTHGCVLFIQQQPYVVMIHLAWLQVTQTTIRGAFE